MGQSQRILVVEDEFVIVMGIEMTLEDHGYSVAGPCATVSEARDIIAEDAGIDAALLDFNLHGETTVDIARDLKRRGIPTVFLTGLHDQAILEEFPDAEIVRKPIVSSDLIDRLAAVIPPA